jgi:hypothetical protein
LEVGYYYNSNLNLNIISILKLRLFPPIPLIPLFKLRTF